MDRLDALTLRQLQSFVAAAGVTSDSPDPDEDPLYPDDADAGGAAPALLWPQVLAGAGLRAHRPPGVKLPAKLTPSAAGAALADDGDAPPEKQVLAAMQGSSSRVIVARH